MLRLTQALKMEDKDEWRGLPHELALGILQYLPPASLLAFACVSQSCLHLASDEALWSRLLYRRWTTGLYGEDNSKRAYLHLRSARFLLW